MRCGPVVLVAELSRMRLAYLDCSSGISGDMTVAALVDAGVDPQAIIAGIDSLGLPGVRLEFVPVMRCAFRHLRQKVHRLTCDEFPQ